MPNQSEDAPQTSNTPNVQRPELKEATKPDNPRAEKSPLSQRESKGKANSYIVFFIVVCCAFLGGIMFFRSGLNESSNSSEPKIAEGYVTPTPQASGDYANNATKAAEDNANTSPKVLENYANAQVGDRFVLGHYPQWPNGEVKPVTWRVLSRDSDNLLVISEEGLDAKPYNEKLVDVAWADCTLRGWLNGEFIKKAFNEQEQSLIKTSEITNNIGPSTQDRVFLLSSDEAKSLFADANDRTCKATGYALKNGASEQGGITWCWLRTRGLADGRAARIDKDGDIICGINFDVAGAIRPAFRLAIK